MVTSTDPYLNQTQYSYSDNFADGINRGTLAFLTKTTFPSTGTPAVQHFTTTEYDANTGLPTAIADLNGNSASLTYDALLRPLTINTPGGGQTSFTYNSPTSTTQTHLITGSQSVSTTTLLDGLGRVFQQQLTTDPAGTDYVDTTYSGNGLVASVSNPHRSTASPTDGITQFAYDALGRVTVQTQPDLNTVQASYSNNCVTVTDEAGKKRENCADALGRVTSVLEPDPGNALTLETDTTYDIFNNALSITQKGGSGVSTDWRTRSFVYDNLSRLTQASAPESGTTNYYYTNASGTLCAGDASLPCRITDARNITKTLAYDALNRLTGKTYSDTTAPVAFKYDETNCLGQASCSNNGFRTSMTDGSGSTAWSYDPVHRISTRKQTIGTTTNSFVYNYNPDGSIASITYPSGRVYTYGYSNAAQITSLMDAAHSINFFTGGTYAPPGMLSGGVHGATTGWNAITLANSFNNRLQPTELKATSPVPSTLLDLGFSYSQPGNNGSVTEIDNGRDSTRSVQYSYDQLNRLSSANTIAATWGNSYVYDNWGNLLQKNVTKGQAENMAILVNSNNQVTTFNYDPAGNVLSDGSVSMTYDAEGRMITAAGTGFSDTYTYDGDGRRVKKSDGTLYWVDDNFQPLSIGTASGVTKDFVFLGGKRIAFVSLASGNAYYYLPDHLGSTAVIASGDGKSTQWDADYYPFGNERKVFTSSINNPFQFTGDEYDSDTQYDYAVARFEAGRWSRFMSPDPYLGSMDLTNPQSLNRYSYVGNNPLNSIDPLGLWCSAPVGNWGDSVCNPANDGGGGGSGSFGDSFTTWIQQPSGWVDGPNGDGGEWTYGYDVTTYIFTGFGGSNPGQRTAPNKACSSALKAANRGADGVARANASWSVLQTAANANGIPTALLAAIAVRESNFMNVQERLKGGGKGPGMGVFQLTNQPGVSAAQAFNIPFAANYAAGMLSSNMKYLAHAFSFTPDQLLQATAASYNFGVGNISGNPSTIDVGTTGGNYGSTVVGMMTCFSHP